MDYKRLNLLYGGLAKKLVKVLIKKTLRKNSRRVNSIFLKLFESRLDVVLYRAKFSQSIKTARQLILHGKIFVNGKLIRIKSYKLKTGDLISVEHTNFKLIKSNKKKCFI
jgi:small subunit ribosomal protein S4